ncbi:hypothetical protein [Streptomyces sp. NBC_00847]|uniref:hypothetical protein n=1 Tax=Streptomyces sp. NBC_00847 TaxID=2975850 RepID=UPI00225E4FBE|nr:hypothetical protein [Streptomyces sp. NBC_00847]MCX4885882.1 hypothetical protein [Streptomyces sp. NBC_00847]
MNDNDDGNDPGNVINFARRTGQTGFTLTPTTTMPTPVIPPPPDPDTTPTITLPRTTRRSPLDALNALPDPGLLAPPVPYNPPAGPAPGMVPDAFRSEPAPDMVGPRLGALSLAAILAVAVAALRGTATYLTDRRQRRLDRAAETDPIRQARLKHQLAMQQAGYDRQLAGMKHTAAMHGIGDKAAQQRSKTSSKVPSSNAFGAKSLSGRSSTGNGSGTGRGRSGGTGSSSSGSGSSGTGRGLKNRGGGAGPKKNGGLFGGGGTGAASKGNGGKEKKPGYFVEPKKPKGPKGPHRTSQGAGAGLKTNNKGKGALGPGGTGKGKGGGRTTLPQALKKDTHKAADRRLNQRRNNPANPILWGAGKNGGKNKQTPGGNGAGKGNKNGQGGTPKPVNLNKPQTPTPGRVHLGQALKKAAVKAARKRLTQRRRNPGTPPIWGAGAGRNQKAAANGPATPGNGQNAGKAAKAARRRQRARAKANGRKQGGRQRAAWWANARAKAKRKVMNGGCFPGNARARQQGAAGNAGQAPGPGGPIPPNGTPNAANNATPGGGRQRKSPFQNAGQAAAQAGATYTVTSDHVPGSKAKRWEPDPITDCAPALPSTGPAALDAAPTKTFPRPGTTRPRRPIPMPPVLARQDPRLVKARKQAARTGLLVTAQARHMDPQHATEITLDDAIDEYGDFKDDAFKTHDKCVKLAGRARQLRDTLALFALELATRHNLIGALFTGAMARLSESMDLLARMADEMQASSLEAAEMAEAADNELNDAYRPYNVATADAGLSTPSAPVHNET